jgi:hypothetical protein
MKIIDLRNPSTAARVPTREDSEVSPNAPQQLNSHGIAFLTLVDDEIQYAACVRYLDALQIPAGYRVEKIAVLGAPSMAEGYQRAMEASTARYKIYVHQDVYLVHRGLLPELLNLFRIYPRLGMVGVLGATRLPASCVWNVKNPLHAYGRIWEYWRQGGLYYLLGPANRRQVYLTRFRSFVGDYLPAVVVDGPLMATQYDLPWVNALGGFMLYDQVQSLEFIKAGLEVGVVRQEAVWCIHWGPLLERTREQGQRRQGELRQKAAAFRQLYSAFIEVPAWSLYERHRKTAITANMPLGKF